MLGLLLRAHSCEVPEEIIVLRPVHEAYISRVSSWSEVLSMDQPPILPKI
jgi:hypothetical protein